MAATGTIGAGTLVPTRPLALAFCLLTPLCMTLAFPPFNLWPMALLAPVGWALLASSDRLPHHMWWVLYGSALLFWLWVHQWMVGVTVAGYPVLCAYLALYAVVGVWLMRISRHGLLGGYMPRAIRLPAVIVALEWMQGSVVFHGYPWYGIGHPLIEWTPLAQIADIGGVQLAAFLIASTSGFIVDGICLRRGTPDPTLRGHVVLGGLIVVVLWTASLVYGEHRMRQWQAIHAASDPAARLRVAVVQTNVTTSNKLRWSRAQQDDDVASFARTTIGLVDGGSGQGPVDFAAWPETMLPGYGLEPETLRTLSEGGWWPGDRFAQLAVTVTERIDAPLLVGSPVYLGLRPDGEVWAWSEHFNCAYMVDGQPPYQRYDKVHLTPFGETMPYISNWKWLEEQLLDIGASGMQFDLDAAVEPRRIAVRARRTAAGRVAGQTCAVLATPICFEDTMASVVRRIVHDEEGIRRATAIVNLSNDGWFGDCDAGRAAHEVIARWRCIENRLPLVRVANTGLCGAFDSNGVRLDGCSIAPRTAGGFIAELPEDPRTTLFGRTGDVLSPAMAIFTVLMVVPRRLLRPARTVALLAAAALLAGGCSAESQPRSVFSGTTWSSRQSSGGTGTGDGPVNPDSGRASAIASKPAPQPHTPTTPAVELESQPIDTVLNGGGTAAVVVAPAPVPEVAPAPALEVKAAPEPAPTPEPAAAAAPAPAPVPAPAPAPAPAPEPAPEPAADAPQTPAPAPPAAKFAFTGADEREQRAFDIIALAASSDAAILRSHALEALQTRPRELGEVACKFLADPNPGVRFAAAVSLGRRRIDRCTMLLQPLLVDQNPSVQAAALFALARLGQRMDLNPLAQLALSTDPQTRANAFFVLGELRNPSAIPVVEACIGQPLATADEVRIRIVELQAAEAMAKMGDYRQYDPIRAALFAPSEQAELIALACQMVGEVNDRGARGSLIGIWNGRGSMERPMEIRLLTGTALLRIGEPNAEPIYLLCMKAVKDPSASIRAQAASTLGWLGGARAADAVTPLLADADPLVSLAAAAAYLRMSEKPSDGLAASTGAGTP